MLDEGLGLRHIMFAENGITDNLLTDAACDKLWMYYNGFFRLAWKSSFLSWQSRIYYRSNAKEKVWAQWSEYFNLNLVLIWLIRVEYWNMILSSTCQQERIYRWKLLFRDCFLPSMGRITPQETCSTKLHTLVEMTYTWFRNRPTTLSQSAMEQSWLKINHYHLQCDVELAFHSLRSH